MQYSNAFIITVFSCSMLGILIAVLRNDIKLKDIENYENDTNNNDDNQKNKNSKNIIYEKDKNKIIKDNDFIIEKDDNDYEDEKNNKNNYIKDNNIHIALNIDNKFTYPCIVFITSLLENRKPSTIYNIHILTSENFNQDNSIKIKSLINKYGENYIKMEFINMKEAFSRAITNEHISTASYYRIRLPSLLPKIDRILYIDTDVINFVDLTEMYNLELKDNIYLRGALDNVENTSELRSFGIYTEKYMNAGILLINLKSMRKYGIEEKIKDFVENHYLEHHDQTAINAVCYNNWEILSVKYATFCFDIYENMVRYNNRQNKRYRYSEEELKQAYYAPTLLHYVGWVKPWDKGNSIKYSEYWWYYAKKTDYYNDILKYYDFSKNIIEELLKKIPKDGGLLKRNYLK